MSIAKTNLNDIQLTLLKLFSRNMSKTEELEIKEMLLSYYDKLLQSEVQNVILQKGYTQADLDNKLELLTMID